ncbi:hypothetical protein AUEXF2481DRAFT_32950 [Aureobasidium subglaciale EXF-2481]|uniref:Apple domain-containing protein n=1 Tax=Aureobasidium subglaciale (strain EXF-2481) TaxID=1043005 RepID=A0A074Y6J1_AURSE|nr:uncharacterized protein AUEXF2481DRAFT_32950 [Aureobasidium subglaciale EXF-2481]KEQ91569.1 hypothetical protein AUEXF2481DRAFT_32950 [Aureobasidium subglaciale EXF-2481]
MRSSLIFSLVASGLVANALPNKSRHLRRQDIDFDLVDDTPEPSKSPTDTQNYNQASAIAAVINDVNTDPLPQQTTDSTSLSRRDVVVVTADGYSQNTVLDGAAINAPLNCNKADTFMGVKLFNDGPFDTTLCAAACTAQTKYNLKHPPTSGQAKSCRFYNTYEMYKDSVYQGQYCTLYTQAWDTTYATNKGQWRGTAHYTIGRSFIASNATDSGLVSCSSPTSSPSISSTSASSTITASSSTSLSLSSSASSSSTTSSSTTSSAPKCTFAPTVDAQQQEKDTAALDFLFSHNTLTAMLSSIPYSVLVQRSLTGDVLPSIQTALQNVVSCGPYNITSQLTGCSTAMNTQQFTSCIIAWTDPAFLSSWGKFPVPTVPTAALTRFINTCGYFIGGQYPEVYPIPAGVTLSPDMTPIAVRDTLTTHGINKPQCDFQMMQYYFGEAKSFKITCS